MEENVLHILKNAIYVRSALLENFGQIKFYCNLRTCQKSPIDFVLTKMLI